MLLSEVGFEPTPPFGDQKPQYLRRIETLESGALDRSAILTAQQRPLVSLGIEASVSEKVESLESGALDHSAILTAQQRPLPFGRCPAYAVMTQDFQRVDATLRSTNQRQFPKPRKAADDMAAL
ncbi:hypothetical protein QQF64_011061 [Cirrhinus molitorella]|uniref:Neurotrophin-3 n=1 Tax=Cirrhinus molitorella TaxID=172907 RepID=A0ABR3M1S6_9TELE